MINIEEYIKQSNNYIIYELEHQNRCEHNWMQHGYGYRCTECSYYTGLDKQLNDAIKLLNETK